jgi:hypothetical protein
MFALYHSKGHPELFDTANLGKWRVYVNLTALLHLLNVTDKCDNVLINLTFQSHLSLLTTLDYTQV